MVIDDLANRMHDCDLLLDQNLYDNPNDRYKDLIPEHSLVKLGPKYAILRQSFMLLRNFHEKEQEKLRGFLFFWWA